MQLDMNEESVLQTGLTKTAGKIDFVKEAHRNVHLYHAQYQIGQEFWFLMGSDIHLDNPKCKRNLLKSHLEEAKQIGAKAFFFGDTLCAMQGKQDKRHSKGDVRKEHQVNEYYDSLVDEAVEFFTPHAEQLAMFTVGNHESAILNRHETNLVKRFVKGLNQFNPEIQMGGYDGWVRINFTNTSTGYQGFGLNIHYSHGHGGGGEVTKGILQSYRKSVYVPDANIVLSGHVHEKYVFPIMRNRITQKGKPFIDEQLHVRLGTYKEEFEDRYGGWAVEKGMPPKPLGAWWMRVKVMRRNGRVVPDVDFIQAR